MELLGALFSPSSKNKIYPPQENFLYFSKYAVLMFKETKISKKFLMFSLQKAIIIFRETEPPPSPPPPKKIKLYLIERNILIFQERGTLKNFLYL